ncbi:lipopolysaccharide assembly protein LapB [Bacteroides sp. 224]|uniref:tetratricopeptide repeat protein n=1 Tax=Bacteroides sp. 224 TaxID=2302936 RepID=UPI0013D65416|nr:hypothetical protein [Bacteroides sp. 224]NDV65445.1 hypothetical protein [Bacteroides sp. 224]
MKQIAIIILSLIYSTIVFSQDVTIPFQNRQQEIDRYWAEANIAYREGKKEEATKLLEKIVDISPFFNAYQALGEIYKELEDIDKISDIISRHKTTIQNNPNSVDIIKIRQELIQLEKYYNQLKKKKDFIDLLQGIWVSESKTKAYSSPNWIFEISKKYNESEIVPYKFQIDKRSPGIQELLSFSSGDSICFVRNIQMYEDGLIKMVFTSRRLQVPPIMLVELGMKVTEEAHDQMTRYIYLNEFSPLKETSYLVANTIIRNLILGELQQQQAKNKVSVIELELRPQEKGKLTGTIKEMKMIGQYTGQVDTILNTTQLIELLRLPEDGASAIFCESSSGLVTISSGMLSRKALNENGYLKALNGYKNKKFAKNWGGALLTIGGASLGTIFLIDDNKVPAYTCYGVAVGGIILWSSNIHRKPIKQYNESLYSSINDYYSNKKTTNLQWSIKSERDFVGTGLSVNF